MHHRWPRCSRTAAWLVEQHRVSWLLLVPTMMLRIWRLPEAVRLAADVSSLEVAFHLAAPCPAWLKQAWIDWLGPQRVIELYGGTELQAVTVISGTERSAAQRCEPRGSPGTRPPGRDYRPPGAASVRCIPRRTASIR